MTALQFSSAESDVERGGQPPDTHVDQLAATFDESVGEHCEDGAGGQLDRARAAAAQRGHTQRQIDLGLGETRRRSCDGEHRQRVSRRCDLDRRERRIDHGVEDRGHLSPLEVLELAVEPFEHDGGILHLEGIGAERAAQPSHHDRGAEAAADHISHHDPDMAVGKVEHVVPVAPDATLVGGQVPRGELEAGDSRQPRRDEAALRARPPPCVRRWSGAPRRTARRDRRPSRGGRCPRARTDGSSANRRG